MMLYAKVDVGGSVCVTRGCLVVQPRPVMLEYFTGGSGCITCGDHTEDYLLRLDLKGPVDRISLAARMSIILSHSEVLLGQNHRNLNCVSMHIFGVQNKKICIETQFKFLWFWPSKTSLWDSIMLILAAREILYTGPLTTWYQRCYTSPPTKVPTDPQSLITRTTF